MSEKITDLRKNQIPNYEHDTEHSISPDLHCFRAQSGELVMCIQFGSAHNYADLFWKAFKRGLRQWDNSLTTRLSQLSIPESPQDIYRFLDQLSQAADRTGDIIFVFDNFHYIKEGRIKNLIINMFDTVCSGVSIVLIMEHNINIAVAGQMRCRRWESHNMQFTRQELVIYYTALGVVLDQHSVDRIYEITEGWPGAVWLLGNHLKRYEALTDTSFDTAITYVHEYIARDLLQYDRKIQEAVICLSLLDDFTTELAVNLIPLSVEELREIISGNRFTMVKENGKTHGFHKMYHQVLANNQVYLSREQKSNFLCRAARWYEKHNEFMKALSYYAESGSYEEMLPILQNISVQMTRPDFSAQIAELLLSIPEDSMTGIPELSFYLYLTVNYAGRQREAARLLDKLQDQLEGKERISRENRILGEIYLIKVFSYWHISPEQYTSYIQKAYQLLPEGTSFLDDDKSYSAGGSILRFEKMDKGDLLRTKEMFLENIQYSRKLLPHTGGARCYLAASESHLYRAEPECAADYAGMAIQEAYAGGDWGVLCEAYYLCLRIYMDNGSLDDLLFYQEQIQLHAENLNPAQACFIVDITRMHMSIYLGLPHLVEKQSFKNLMKISQLSRNPNAGRELYASARYLTDVAKQYIPAITYIDGAIPVCRRNGRWFSELKLILLKAVVYGYLDRKELSIEFLIQAYEMSYINKIYYPFMEFGKDFIQLVHQIQKDIPESKIPVQWLEQMTAGAEKYEAHRRQLAQEFLLRNPYLSARRLGLLSEKEYLTLRYICQGLSTEQTAEKMGIQASSVYINLHRIYKKFGTDDRREAVEIAIAEGILG